MEELNWDTSVYATTTYTYNGRDQLTQINQSGQLRTFEYDGYGRLAARVTPEQGRTTYAYNPDDTLYTMTDARNSVTRFIYNARHQVVSQEYPTENVNSAWTGWASFQYDGAGNRIGMSDGLGSASYNYDQLSRLTSETRSFNDLGAAYTLSYTYNRGGELTSVTNPWSASVGYQYDTTGRVQSVTGAGYAGVASYISNIEYRAFGAKKMVYGNGRQLDVLYNNRLQMTRWTVGGVLDDEYFYTNSGENNTGRVTFVQSNLDRTLDHSYAYDSVGRLTFAYTGAEARAHVGNGSWGNPDGPYALGYEYDVFGNMTRRYGWGGWNYAYTASYVNNRRVGDQYDAAGNLSSSGGQSFTYDASNQQAIAYTYSLSQYYDGDRLRVKKVESGQPTYYLRSSVLGGQVICEINGSGEWTKGYVYLGSQLLAIQQQGTVQWVHQEPVTKAQRLTNTAGQVVSTLEFDPFGGETYRSSNAALQPHKFTTYERNANSDDYAMNRQYEGFWSRFIQPDPFDGSYDLTNPQSLNRYSYTQNDPVNFVDPSGLEMCTDNWCGGAGFNAGIGYSGFGGFGGGFNMNDRSGGGGLDTIGAREAERAVAVAVTRFFNYLPADAHYIGDLSWGYWGEDSGDVMRSFTLTFNVDAINSLIFYNGEFAFHRGPYYYNVYGRDIGCSDCRGLETDWDMQLMMAAPFAGALRSSMAGAAESTVRQPNRIYSARELLRRAAESGPFHNFPESFNKFIFQGQRTAISDSYVLYTRPGSINGVRGVFEIGVRPSASGGTEVIIHRFFRPIR